MDTNKQLVDFSEFSPEETRTLQLKLLEILDALDAFCKENNLTYFLTGGTLLGAIRHKGFIPWDDDVDVALPRKDYERLFELWNNEGNRFQLLRPTKDTLTGVHIALLRDSETTCIYDYAVDYDICHGLKIDIEPIDGCPDGRLGQKLQWFFCQVFALMAAQRIPNQGTESLKKRAKTLLSIFRGKRIRYFLFHFAEKMVERYSMDKCSKVRIAYAYIFDKEIFSEQIFTEYEGRQFPIPKGYDVYLKRLYKDYMQFPPEDDRKPRTVVRCYDPNTSYKEYRGTQYLINK
ncbi:MAG: LicD family protein [Clostridia bacterium]|nr:LicD family protein [Clostridia bacterium]